MAGTVDYEEQLKKCVEVHYPDVVQKTLKETLSSVRAELVDVERRQRDLRLIERACTAGLAPFEQDVPCADPYEDGMNCRPSY